MIWTKLGYLEALEAMRTGTVLLDGLGIALFVNNFIPTSDAVLADFTEASFPGYAPLSLSTPNPAFLNGQGRGEVDADLATFTATGVSAQNAFGYFLYTAGLVVVAAERFAAPQPMMAAGSSLDVGVKFTDVSEFNG